MWVGPRRRSFTCPSRALTGSMTTWSTTSSLRSGRSRARVEGVRIPATKYPIERFTLANGLRVVLNPDKSAPVIGVAVVYDVGIRSEPEGRTGFAHLFEHLMFQGSQNLEKL